MVESGEERKETIRPEFNQSIMIDFQGTNITSDTGFLLLREIDDRFGILGPTGSELEDTRSWIHSKHSQLQSDLLGGASATFAGSAEPSLVRLRIGRTLIE